MYSIRRGIPQECGAPVKPRAEKRCVRLGARGIAFPSRSTLVRRKHSSVKTGPRSGRTNRKHRLAKSSHKYLFHAGDVRSPLTRVSVRECARRKSFTIGLTVEATKLENSSARSRYLPAEVFHGTHEAHAESLREFARQRRAR